ncbi:glycosyltransferase family 9 protein [Allokutzneria albata]|uniref:ADP-heptose:LPS heptosyltransferase n=1 Tax=Allokutzneria albata TaxID=211114 RepID=A0A1G9WUV3_ALLAB|nr:glycosyltransferase family 9 protein [Allokutzneria albata]SDM88332.1 ADP-heptose:LPS heptosyltransferase [Allokutzneria albata]
MSATFHMPAPRPAAAAAQASAEVQSHVDWTDFGRILVVRPGNFGDALMLTPALRALRAAAPDSRIDLLTSPSGAAARELVAALDGVVVGTPSWYDRATGTAPVDIRRCAWQEQALIGSLAKRGYEAMIVFTSATQSPWAAAHAGLLAGIEVRAVHSAETGGLVASHSVRPPEGPVHQIDRALHLLHGLGVPVKGAAVRVDIPERARAAADIALGGSSTPFALLTPGCTRDDLRYSATGFATTAAMIADSGLPVLVTGSPRERDLVAEVVSRARHPGVRALEPVSVAVLAAVIARAEVLVGNDSGPMHLAEAVGTPVAIAYGGADRDEDTRPRLVRARLVRGTVSCLDIAPADLASAALAVLHRAPSLPLTN